MQGQEFVGGQPVLEAEVFGQKADAGTRGAVSEWSTQQESPAGGGRDQSHQHLDRGGLARPVGSQESKHLTLLDLQGEAFYCGVVAEFFSKLDRFRSQVQAAYISVMVGSSPL